MAKHIVSWDLGQCVPIQSSYWFLFFFFLLSCFLPLTLLNVLTTKDPLLWLYAKSTNWRQFVETRVCVWICTRPLLFPLPPASWHPFSCFTSPDHLFAFSIFPLSLSFCCLLLNLGGPVEDLFRLYMKPDSRVLAYCWLPPCTSRRLCLKSLDSINTGLTLYCCVHSLHTEVGQPLCTHKHTNQHKCGHKKNGWTCIKES